MVSENVFQYKSLHKHTELSIKLDSVLGVQFRWVDLLMKRLANVCCKSLSQLREIKTGIKKKRNKITGCNFAKKWQLVKLQTERHLAEIILITSDFIHYVAGTYKWIWHVSGLWKCDVIVPTLQQKVVTNYIRSAQSSGIYNFSISTYLCVSTPLHSTAFNTLLIRILYSNVCSVQRYDGLI